MVNQLPSPSPNGFGVPRGNHLPGKVLLVCPAASLGQRSSILAIAQDTHQRFAQLLFLLSGNQDDARLGNRRRRLSPAVRNHRKAAGNSRDGAAPAAGNGSAHKQQNVRGRQPSRDFFAREYAGNLHINLNIPQTVEQEMFAIIRLAPKCNQPQLWNTDRRQANGLGNDFTLQLAGFASRDPEDGDRRDVDCPARPWLRSYFWHREICAHGDENAVAATGRHPRKLFGGNGKHGHVCKAKRVPHCAELHTAAQEVNETPPRIGLRIVEDDAHARARGAQNSQDAGKAEWESAAGPSQRRVLNENRRAAPTGGLSAEFPQRGGPASSVPGNAREFERETVRTERGAEVAAIFLYRVGRFVSPPEQRNARLLFVFFDRRGRDGSIP